MARESKSKSAKNLVPPSLEELRQHRSINLSVQWDHEKLRWKVEASPATARKLLASFDELQILKAKHEQTLEQHSELQRKFSELQHRAALLERNNDTLLKNIAADKRPEKFAKSPRNYFQAAQGRGLDVEVSGGLPSLGKRR
jgi:hypothetical protein